METNTIAMSGDDTVVINGRNIVDFGDGDIGTLEYPNEVMVLKTGKNGNTIYSFNATGKQAQLSLRIVRGSADDKFFQNLLNLQQNDPSRFVLMNGEFIKEIGDGKGNVSYDTYLASGGVFTKIPGAKSNAEGDTEQSIVIYNFAFSKAPRTLT